MPIKKKAPVAKKPAVKKPVAKKPAAKKPLGPKAKLMALSVAALRKKAKALGVSDYTKRPKENLVQSIILGEARKNIGKVIKRQSSPKTAAGSRQTNMRKRDIVKDMARRAEAPGKRKSRTGRTYYERRANRSDVTGTFLGEKYNGWANWETWNANLWDGEAFYDLVQEAKDSGDDKNEIAAMLESFYDDAVDSLGARGFFSDVLGHSLGKIDWDEIVEAHWEE